jgi:pyruvate formate lyase activating enzyme
MEVNYGGCVPFSTVDYPGRACITIFLRGCSRRCPWCHNQELQTGETPVPIQYIHGLIHDASQFVSAVVISGGEPLEQMEACMNISAYARNLGLLVGVHTSRRDRAIELNYWFDMMLVSDPTIDPRVQTNVLIL